MPEKMCARKRQLLARHYVRLAIQGEDVKSVVGIKGGERCWTRVAILAEGSYERGVNDLRWWWRFVPDLHAQRGF